MFYVIDDPHADKTNFIPMAVVGGDHHIHSWKHPDPEQRIDASANVLWQGMEHARKLNVPLIVNGDLTHDKNSLDPLVTATLSKMFASAKAAGVRVILNVGNHERTEKFHEMHTLACFEPVVDFVASAPHLIRLTRASASFRQADLSMNVMLVPFYYNHKQAMADIDIRNLWNEVGNGPLVFVGHYPVDGAEVNGIKPRVGSRLL